MFCIIVSPYQVSFRSDKNDSARVLPPAVCKNSDSGRELCRHQQFSGDLLHLVGNAYEAQEHIERSPERCEILCFNMQDQRIIPLNPSLRRGPGIYILLQLRKKRAVDLIGVIGRKPEQGFMLRHRNTS
jgi:hypothetical protein